MNVASRADLGHCTPNVMAILQNRGVLLQVRESNFVTQRHYVERRQGNGLIRFHDPSAESLPGLNIFYDDHAHIVGFIVHNKIDCHLLLFNELREFVLRTVRE
jgi:hypothetical protein